MPSPSSLLKSKPINEVIIDATLLMLSMRSRALNALRSTCMGSAQSGTPQRDAGVKITTSTCSRKSAASSGLMPRSARLPVYTLLIAIFIPRETILGGLLGWQGVTLFAIYVFGIRQKLLMPTLSTGVRGRHLYEDEKNHKKTARL